MLNKLTDKIVNAPYYLQFVSAVLIVTIVSSLGVSLSAYATFHTENVDLTVTVLQSVTFTVATPNALGNLTPGTSVLGTSTMSVATNNVAGWSVTLECDERTTNAASAVTNQCGDLDSDTTVELPDPATNLTWIVDAATATTTGGSAASISDGVDGLYFRVTTASGSDKFTSDAWWGTSDVDFNGSQKWAGIPSPTNASRIGEAGSGSYSASAHLNDVVFYLDVPATQQTGAYTAPLTFTLTGN